MCVYIYRVKGFCGRTQTYTDVYRQQQYDLNDAQYESNFGKNCLSHVLLYTIHKYSITI